MASSPSTSSSAETQQPFPISPSSPHSPEPTESDPETPRRTVSIASVEDPLLPDEQPRSPRSHAVSPTFVSSPLNPNAPTHTSRPPSLFNGSRTPMRHSMVFNRVASEESQALASHLSSVTPNRSSMILYRLADENEQLTSVGPPVLRHSVRSSSGESALTVSYDSKYPSGAHTPHKFVPYPFDPNSHIDTPEEDDALHDPSDETPLEKSSGIALRGFMNVGVLILVVVSLLCLFIFYPVWHYSVEGNSTVP